MAQKHHIVQEKYLAQWHNPSNKNQLQIRLHDTGKIADGGANSRIFWKADFNVAFPEDSDRYAPELFTSDIDGKAIKAIRKIVKSKDFQLSNEDRNIIAAYTALQWVRTPKYRKEMDDWINAMYDLSHKQNFVNSLRSDDGKLQISKNEILKHKPETNEDVAALKEIQEMSDEDFQQMVDELDFENVNIKLNNEGHSKSLYKSVFYAETLFKYEWIFFFAAEDTSFITSDNPCFITSFDPKRPFCGVNSNYAQTIFPLSPTICLWIDHSKNRPQNIKMTATRTIVRDINKLILQNSCDCVVAKDRNHLTHLTKNYKHQKFKEIKVTEIGDYVWVRSE